MSDKNQIEVWESRITSLKDSVSKKVSTLKWVLAGVVLIILGPAILTGVLAGTAALIAGVIAFAAVQMFPVFSRYLVNKRTEMLIAEANRHLQAVKAEARKSPIETMQNVFQEQARQLKERADKITKFATKVNKYGQQVQELKKRFPSDAATFDRVHADMAELLKRRQAKWKEAKAKHDQSSHEIERAQAIWEMGQATAELRESAGDLEAEFMQKIRRETAMDAVQESLAAAMADLDQLMMEEVPLSSVEQKAIANAPSPMLVQPVEDARVVTTISREAISRKDY
jgi:DNA repair exonuclease SbcCD ATPase subunit